MYPDLYYLVRALTELEWPFLHTITTFGLSIALSFLAGACFLKKRFLEQEAQGFYTSKKESLIRSGKPAAIIPSRSIGGISLFATLLGLAIGKLFYIAENYRSGEGLSALFSFSGINFYGALAGMIIAVLIYYRYNNIKPLYVFDATAPGFMIAYCIGRLGCHVSGDGDWGIENNWLKPLSWLPDWLWAYDYPHNILRQGVIMNRCDWGNYCYRLAAPVWPTPLYEAIVCLILFLLLWNIRNKTPGPGFLMGLYLVLAGLERFLFELIRINHVIKGLNITQAQLVSILLIAIGLTLIARAFRYKKFSA